MPTYPPPGPPSVPSSGMMAAPVVPPPAPSRGESRASSPPPSVRTGAPPSVRTGPPPSVRPGSIPSPLESRHSLPKFETGNPGRVFEGIALGETLKLVDRLAAADESAFIVGWLEAQIGGRTRVEPSLSVRLLRAYRETGRIDRARDLVATLPPNPQGWNAIDTARLFVERAILAMLDGRTDHSESELRQAGRAIGTAARGTGLREQLDLQLTTAQLELKLGRNAPALAALKLAEHLAERIDDGPWRASVSMLFGHLAMRLADPRAATRHYGAALARSTTMGTVSLSAQANMAIALGSVGRFDEARHHATQSINIARDLGSTWRQADGHDVLAIVEIAADRPLAALHAVDEAQGVLGDPDQPVSPLLRYQLAEHRTWALAQLGRMSGARQWLEKAEAFYAELPAVDLVDEHDLIVARVRTLEAAGQYQEALETGIPHATRFPEAFVTGSLNLCIGRSALLQGDQDLARVAVERAALSGDLHGWIFPDRALSRDLWRMAKQSGDSRVVRYAERMLGLLASPVGSIPPPAPSRASLASLPNIPIEESFVDNDLIYVTTAEGVSRVKREDLAEHTAGIDVVVDTMTHALRVHSREVSLERRRALEPLVVQLLRRAREGLSAEEILRAAGGPGPESADAEHRVRVLISRVRDLFGDAAAIERVRDAGEHGKTRYRVAGAVRFALVEPLFVPMT
jgi:tetratricopeptide (TPR) repeat protein